MIEGGVSWWETFDRQGGVSGAGGEASDEHSTPSCGGGRLEEGHIKVLRSERLNEMAGTHVDMMLLAYPVALLWKCSRR